MLLVEGLGVGLASPTENSVISSSLLSLNKETTSFLGFDLGVFRLGGAAETVLATLGSFEKKLRRSGCLLVSSLTTG